MPVVEDVEQVPPLFSIEYRESPVIEDDEVSLGKLREELVLGAVAACDGDVGEQSRDTEIACREAVTTSAMSNGAGAIGFADAGGSGDEDVEMVVDAAAAGKFIEGGFIEAAGCAMIDVLHGGVELELGAAESIGELPVRAYSVLTFDAEGEPVVAG